MSATAPNLSQSLYDSVMALVQATLCCAGGGNAAVDALTTVLSQVIADCPASHHDDLLRHVVTELGADALAETVDRPRAVKPRIH